MNKPLNTAGNFDSPRRSPRPMPAGAEFRVGALVSDTYEIVDYLGRGAMGFVYRARHLILSKEYALKTLGAEQISDTAWRRFQNEAQAIAKMNHPNVVGIHNFGLHHTVDGFDIPFYVMDLLEGGSLTERLQEGGTLPLTVALQIFQQVAAGLRYAHTKGIIHRDVKPGNIVLLAAPDSSGAILKIVDFGIAKLTDNELYSQKITNVGEVFGSPYYMSPEQSLAQKVDSRTDIYSLGVSLFESLVGVTPFAGKSAVETLINHQTASLPQLNIVANRDFPPDLQTVLEIMMAKKPEDRYQSMEQVIADLSALEHGRSPAFITAGFEHDIDRSGYRQALTESALSTQFSSGSLNNSNSAIDDEDGAEKNFTNLPRTIFLSLTAAILFSVVVFHLVNSSINDAALKGTAKADSIMSNSAATHSTVNGRVDKNGDGDAEHHGREIKWMVGESLGRPARDVLNERSDLDSGVGELGKVFIRSDDTDRAYAGQQKVSLDAQKENAKYSSIELLNGRRYRTFKFPQDVFIGSIFSAEFQIEKDANGTWKAPESARLCYRPSLLVSKYPQFLKRFSPGDIYSISLRPKACSDQLLEQLSVIPGVHELSVKQCKKFTPGCFKAFSKFKHLNVLDLSQSNVDGATLAQADCMGEVNKIVWSEAVKPTPLLRQLAGCPNLLSLDLQKSHLTHDDCEAISRIPNLQVLEIPQNKVSVDDLKCLSRLPQLAFLNVQECDLKPNAVPVLKKFRSLRDLKIFTNGTSTRMSEALFKDLSHVAIH